MKITDLNNAQTGKLSIELGVDTKELNPGVFSAINKSSIVTDKILRAAEAGITAEKALNNAEWEKYLSAIPDAEGGEGIIETKSSTGLGINIPLELKGEELSDSDLDDVLLNISDSKTGEGTIN